MSIPFSRSRRADLASPSFLVVVALVLFILLLLKPPLGATGRVADDNATFGLDIIVENTTNDTVETPVDNTSETADTAPDILPPDIPSTNETSEASPEETTNETTDTTPAPETTPEIATNESSEQGTNDTLPPSFGIQDVN
ncbi:MAG TPA: hypothetical protein VLJ21_03025, partial [Candidatus Binatia bacterium]|nr:hypothetical protein [Candidatus Binatia bacterium]